MKNDKKVMAIILNYNSWKDSMKCAKILKEQSYEKLTIAIIDNNSTDDSKNKLRNFCGENDILLIESEVNGGFSAGNNLGLKEAAKLGCEYSLIINPDMEIRDKNYVRKAVRTLDRDNSIAVLGSDVINMQGKHQNPMRELNFFENTFWFIMLIILRIVKRDIYVGNYNKSGYVHKVSGCCFFIRTEFIKEQGYMDENVFMYCEEPILAGMVKRAGMKEYYLADTVAYHMHIHSEKGNNAKNLERFYDSRIYYISKYRYKGIIGKVVVTSIKIQKKLMIKRALRGEK